MALVQRAILAIFCMTLVFGVERAEAREAVTPARTADEVSDQFNQTGRAMPMTVALHDDGRSLGEVVIRVDSDDGIAVSKGSLTSVLQDIADAATLSRLAALPEMIPLHSLKANGLDISFDKRQIILVMGLAIARRKDNEISFASSPSITSGALAKPSTISGYVNTFLQSDYLWESEQTGLRMDVEATVRAGNFVFESEFALENSVNSQFCPPGALCLFDHSSGLKRRGSRMVYDLADWQDRLTIGDTRSQAATFQRAPDVLGITLEHAPAKLDPTKPIRATGSQSFILERSGTVDVLINGAVAQRLHLPPGSHNLRDLPLRAGANDITLLITDETGATRTLHFNSFSAYALLGVGKSEWSVTGGVPSYYADGQIGHVNNRYIASAFARYGWSDQITVEAHAQADNNLIMSGGGAIVATSFGIWGIQLAASRADAGSERSDMIGTGTGGAARITWDLTGAYNAESLRLSAEIHSGGFRSPGQVNVAPTGILYPVFDSKMSFSAAYTRQLWDTWQTAVTASYNVANDTFTSANPLVARGDRYHLDLSLTRPVWDNATISGTVGYSNEVYSRSFSRISGAHLNDAKGEWWAGIRLFWHTGVKTFVTAASDTLSQRSVVAGTTQSSSGLNAWTTTVVVSDDRALGNAAVDGAVTYRGQRAEVTAGHDSPMQVFGLGQSGVSLGQQRSRVRVGTALVFAGNTVAISAPVSGDGGFAILSAHPSLGDRTITAGTAGNLRAESGILGPAVVTGLAAYVPQTLPIDVVDLPLGYSLGASGFDVRPSYKSGYNLQVGSGYSVSAFGTLVDSRGTPLALAGGLASNGVKHATVSTNQSGKFAADGLAEGRWTLTMESESGPVGYVIEVPPGTQGLLRLGVLTPVKG